MARAKPKPIAKSTIASATELAQLEKKHRAVFARRDEIVTKLKDDATKRGDGFKIDLPKLGVVKVAGRKEKEFLGEVPEAVPEAWKKLSASERKALIKKGVIAIVDNWSGAFYGRVTVELF